MSDEANGAGVPVSEEVPSSAVPTDVAESDAAGTSADESAGESATPDNDGEQHEKKQGGFQRRISKLNQRLSSVEQEKEYWRQQALRTNPPQTTTAPAETDATPEPNPDDFQTLNEYLKAHTKWTREEAKREVLAELEQRQQAASKQSEQQKVTESWQAKVVAARTKYADFDEVISDPEIPIPPHVAEAIVTSEVGTDVAYYLGTHPDEAARIAQMTPLNAAREIGKLELRLAPPQESAAQPKATPPVTKAPPPPTPVSKAAVVKAPSVYDPDLSYKEWVKVREAQLAKRK